MQDESGQLTMYNPGKLSSVSWNLRNLRKIYTKKYFATLTGKNEDLCLS